VNDETRKLAIMVKVLSVSVEGQGAKAFSSSASCHFDWFELRVTRACDQESVHCGCL